MDYLLVQASSVPCEHVFSSAAETDTKKCNRLHPSLMEALQILKFIYKKDRLNFTAGYLSLPEEPGRNTSDARLLGNLLTDNAEETTDRLLRIYGEDDSDDEA